MAGKLYGVGVGPGDPMLMTLKAVKCIEECDIIGIPAKEPGACTAWRIAAGAVTDIEDKEVLPVIVPMTKDYSLIEAAYDEGSERIRKVLDDGRNVAFLNLGDPTLYGTYMGIHKRITGMGYEAVIIPGVSSICAVAAKLGIPLGERSDEIHILPGSYGVEKIDSLSGTKVIMKSAGRADDVVQYLGKAQECGKCRVCAVTDCGMADEKVFTDIERMEERPGYFTTFIVREADGM